MEILEIRSVIKCSHIKGPSGQGTTPEIIAIVPEYFLFYIELGVLNFLEDYIAK